MWRAERNALACETLNSSSPATSLVVVGVLIGIVGVGVAHAQVPAREPRSDRGSRSVHRVQQAVDELKGRLSIESPVTVSIVPTNARVMSVTAAPGGVAPFQLAIEGTFLNLLTDDELSAAIAHELGHVWISTHHPYLQTERLANEIAMRIVSRASLEHVYEKMWARTGRKGDLVSLLGPAPEQKVVPVASEVAALDAAAAGTPKGN